MEVEATDEGTLGRIVVPAGTEGVAVNAVIGLILEDGEDASASRRRRDSRSCRSGARRRAG